MAEKIEFAVELDGLDELTGACEEVVEHLEAAMRLLEQLQGEHVLTPRVVSRSVGRTTSRSSGTSSEGGAS